MCEVLLNLLKHKDAVHTETILVIRYKIILWKHMDNLVTSKARSNRVPYGPYPLIFLIEDLYYIDI